MMQTNNGTGMRRFVNSGSLALIALAAQTTVGLGQVPTKVSAQGKSDSMKVDSVRYPSTRPTRVVLRLTEQKIDSLVQVRDRLPLGSTEIRRVEEEIDQIMVAVMPKGTGFIRFGTFTVVVEPGNEVALRRNVMIASRPLPPDVSPKGYIGMTADGANIGWTDSTGIYVQYAEYPTIVRVAANSPAAKVGIRFGDSLVAYNGTDVRRNAINITRLLEPGRTIEVRLRREGEVKEVSVLVEKAPAGFKRESRTPLEPGEMMPTRAMTIVADSNFERRVTERAARVGAVAVAGGRGAGTPTPSARITATTAPQGILGVHLADLDPAVIKAISQQKAERGVLVLRVPDGSPGSRMGLKTGDLIISVGDIDVISTHQLYREARTVGPDRPLWYVVLREGKTTKLLYDPK